MLRLKATQGKPSSGQKALAAFFVRTSQELRLPGHTSLSVPVMVRCELANLEPRIPNQVAILTDQEKEELGTQLLAAVKANNEEKVKELLAQGAPVNTRNQYTGKTALMVAASYSSPNLFQLLLEADADVNVIDELEHTLLQDVIILNLNIEHDEFLNQINNRRHMLNLLLQKPVNINAQNKSARTALWEIIDHMAYWISRLEGSYKLPLMREYYTSVIQILISAGATVDVQDTRSGKTPLMIALEQSRHRHAPVEDCNDIIKMLVVAGANLDLQDNKGKTAMN